MGPRVIPHFGKEMPYKEKSGSCGPTLSWVCYPGNHEAALRQVSSTDVENGTSPFLKHGVWWCFNMPRIALGRTGGTWTNTDFHIPRSLQQLCTDLEVVTVILSSHSRERLWGWGDASVSEEHREAVQT